jgi:L-alanine-DL-glutamate epimerase-like enolase superfamily enzyme
LTRCTARGCPPQALAAIDLALWDLAGRRAGKPVWRLLGAHHPSPVPVNATIGALAPNDAAEAASSAQADGYCTVKVKVGVGDDLNRIRAIRSAVGPALAIRLDANGAWSVEQAIATLNALEPLGIECCEEPVHGLEQNERVAAATAIAVALDETVSAAGAFTRRVCEAVCLKIAASGGVTGLLANAGRARRLGYRVYLASTLDGPLGIAAALHAACAVSIDLPCGLATLGAFEGADNSIPAHDARMLPPDGAGLGDARLALYQRWAKRLL